MPSVAVNVGKVCRYVTVERRPRWQPNVNAFSQQPR